jgi:ADP-heptose:LPS heptosyltransferase
LKILILRFSSIGDIVLTTPVIRCIKTQLKDVEVHFASKKPFASFLKVNPYIDKLHLLDTSDRGLINRLKKEKFDYIIDLHHNIRTFRIKKALGAKSFSFNKLNLKKALLVNFKINQMPDVHIVDRYMDTVIALGVTNDLKGLDYFVPESDKIDLASLPTNFREGFATFAIGGQHQTKRLPLHKQIELCKKIAGPIVLLGGKEDLADSENIANHFNDPAKIYNAVSKINLNQSASFVEQSNRVFTHDTGMMHIAAAFKKNIVAIWGNTVPDFGMYPYLTNYLNLQVHNLSCRPCSKIGFNECPKGHFKCMEDQKFDLI